MVQSANPDQILKVPTMVERLALAPSNGTVCIQLDNQSIWVYNSIANVWVGAGNPPISFSYNLTNADLLGMYPTPLVVYPPVAGEIFQLVTASIEYTFGTTPFTSAGGILDLQYTGGGIITQFQNTVFLGGSAEAIQPPSGGQPMFRGQGVQLVQSSFPLTGGDGTAVLRLYFNLLL